MRRGESKDPYVLDNQCRAKAFLGERCIE